MSKFTSEEIQLLKKYVTDPEGNVFCVTNLEGIVGAVYARYSRAKGGFREVLLKEFIQEGMVDIKKASDLIDRVLIAYGDDSVGELEGTHVSFENISILLTKEIEDRRIGGSPIEQSTRYVFYDQKDDQGRWKYYRSPKIMASSVADDYEKTMDYIFNTYSDLVEPMKAYYQTLKPLEEAEYDVLGTGDKQSYNELSEEKDQKAFRMTYNADIRTKACDSLRSILPLATTTNVGIFGNGRFFQGVLSHLYTSDLTEAQEVGKAAQAQLDQVIPKYVKRAQRNEYRVANRNNMRALAQDLFKDIEPKEGERLVLMDKGESYVAERLNELTMEKVVIRGDDLAEFMQEEKDNFMYALMLYEYLEHPLTQILSKVRRMSPETKEKIRDTYIGDRQTRRDRPYRALEAGYEYTFDMVTDYGTYKDLERHRMTSQLRQKFSPLLGFEVPQDIKDAGLEDKVLGCHERILELYEKLLEEVPEEASYATLHGNRVRYVMAFNEREAYHLLELRTTPQGHPQYRKVCQILHKLIENRSQWRADKMKFVDHNDYFWTRGDSEAKQRVKEKLLEQKNSDES